MADRSPVAGRLLRGRPLGDQEAAQRLRDDPSVTISQVAVALGHADHAHLSTDFRHVLGVTPSAYRHDADRAP